MSREIKKFNVSKLPLALVYHTFSFLDPKDIVELLLVSPYLNQQVNLFLNNSVGRKWNNHYADFREQQIRIWDEKLNSTMVWAGENIDKLSLGWRKYTKYTILSLLICVRIVRGNPWVVTWVDPTAILRNVHWGAQRLALTAFGVVGGTLIWQSVQKCRKNKNLKENEKVLRMLEKRPLKIV